MLYSPKAGSPRNTVVDWIKGIPFESAGLFSPWTEGASCKDQLGKFKQQFASGGTLVAREFAPPEFDCKIVWQAYLTRAALNFGEALKPANTGCQLKVQDGRLQDPPQLD